MTQIDRGTADISFAPSRVVVGRVRGGLAALSYPLLLVATSLSVGFRKAGDLQDFAATFVGSMLTVVALPTVWFLSFDFIDVTRMTVYGVGLATSLPLWYFLGAIIGDRSPGWGVWIRTYLAVCLTWTLVSFTILAVLSTWVS
jgi:hypothetical protein